MRGGGQRAAGCLVLCWWRGEGGRQRALAPPSSIRYTSVGGCAATRASASARLHSSPTYSMTKAPFRMGSRVRSPHPIAADTRYTSSLCVSPRCVSPHVPHR